MRRLLLAAGLIVAAVGASAQTPKATVPFLYLAEPPSKIVSSTALAPLPPVDEGVLGARLALSEVVATGRFLGIGYDMQEAVATGDDAVLAAAQVALAAGRRVLVTSIRAPLLLRLADLPEARDALILDISTTDDALRGADCRRNVLHLAPSRAMLADALMQFLVTKNWRHVLLLRGRAENDILYADAVRKSARKFQVKIVDDREWKFNPAAQQADTGHFQINTEVADATSGAPAYDVLVAADEGLAFANQLGYRTSEPRPIAGSSGLVATVWTSLYDEYAAAQIQTRFRNKYKRPMTAGDFNAWLAVRAIGEATTRGGGTEVATMGAFMRGPDFQVAGYKGAPLSFRPWDGQLRQPILLADDRSLVSISPQPGFLHQFNVLDTLGADQPETACHL